MSTSNLLLERICGVERLSIHAIFATALIAILPFDDPSGGIPAYAYFSCKCHHVDSVSHLCVNQLIVSRKVSFIGFIRYLA